MASGKVRVVKQISQFLVRVDFFLPLFERLCEIARCQRAQDTRAISISIHWRPSSEIERTLKKSKDVKFWLVGIFEIGKEEILFLKKWNISTWKKLQEKRISNS